MDQTGGDDHAQDAEEVETQDQVDGADDDRPCLQGAAAEAADQHVCKEGGNTSTRILQGETFHWIMSPRKFSKYKITCKLGQNCRTSDLKRWWDDLKTLHGWVKGV